MISTVVYADGQAIAYEDLAAARTADGTTWVHATDATPDEVEAVSSAFDLHSLAIEDIKNDVRANVQDFNAYTFVLVKSASLTPGDTTFDKEVKTTPLGLFIGPDWIVTLSTGAVPSVQRVMDAVGRGDERLLHRGPDFTAYRVIDVIVDAYFDLLDEIETDIEQIEEEVTTSTDIETLERINDVRRDLLSFRKQVWPAREAIGVLARGDPKQIQPQTEKYFRDVYDHLVQIVDLTETYRDLVAGARDIYLNTVSQSTNEVMKMLTVVATIFIPLTFVVGVYGMNFADSPYNMPELGWAFGYPAVMIGMVIVVAVLLGHFRQRDYL
ncbi:magnesium/cobalt transporter CorA [Haloarcula argentinensis]|uniref:Magnesium transport protein CorA n=1 Tax=Haloarcula argentinensis TaxID=43776 RepID=A0A830FHJ3_HALAR|nr:magnesium/cobalt transporter CorA [Haloarcula argentinensis]EMA18718.1 magnesium and cobalt transport protein CorA [Haloarcula argentinensis DSM 12282]MDS0253720.1 magnesium/cobalt transporter CorA [Haloarcula argentinensis]GGM47252.1 cobalt/magnesium transport protein CorA [Haloarcula argentinensis]